MCVFKFHFCANVNLQWLSKIYTRALPDLLSIISAISSLSSSHSSRKLFNSVYSVRVFLGLPEPFKVLQMFTLQTLVDFYQFQSRVSMQHVGFSSCKKIYQDLFLYWVAFLLFWPKPKQPKCKKMSPKNPPSKCLFGDLRMYTKVQPIAKNL